VITVEATGGQDLNRRRFLSLVVGGAAVGVAAGYAINQATAVNNPDVGNLAQMAVYAATYGEILALRADTGTVRWAKPLITSEFLAAGSGGVYATSDNGEVYALNSVTGTMRWSYRISGGTESPFPSVNNNMVYIAPGGGYTYALDAATGQLRWRHQTTSDSYSQPPVIYRGIVYVGDPDSYVYALDAVTGEFRWRFGRGGQSSQGMLIVAQDVLFAVGSDHLYALNLKSGKVQGVYPAVLPCANGVAYIGSTDGSLQARNIIESKVLWTRRLVNAEWLPAATAGNVVYLGIQNTAWNDINVHTDWVSKIIALDVATGKTIWDYIVPVPIYLPPLVVAGVVFVIGRWTLFALNAATGEIRWLYNTVRGVSASVVARS
jgi:outer membrane protein assembly factor BamB